LTFHIFNFIDYLYYLFKLLSYTIYNNIPVIIYTNTLHTHIYCVILFFIILDLTICIFLLNSNYTLINKSIILIIFLIDLSLIKFSGYIFMLKLNKFNIRDFGLINLTLYIFIYLIKFLKNFFISYAPILLNFLIIMCAYIFFFNLLLFLTNFFLFLNNQTQTNIILYDYIYYYTYLLIYSLFEFFIHLLTYIDDIINFNLLFLCDLFNDYFDFYKLNSNKYVVYLILFFLIKFYAFTLFIFTSGFVYIRIKTNYKYNVLRIITYNYRYVLNHNGFYIFTDYYLIYFI